MDVFTRIMAQLLILTASVCAFLSVFPTCRMGMWLLVSWCVAAACCPTATLTWRTQTTSMGSAATLNLGALWTLTPGS